MRLLLDGSSIGVEDDEGKWVDDDRDETVEDDDSTMLVGASALDESSEHAAKLKKMLAAIGAKIL